MDTTGNRIKKLRIEHGLSQEDLAKKLGYSHKSAINKIELNINGVPASKIVLLSKIFGVSISYLLCDDVSPEKPAPINSELWAEICADPEKLRLVERIVSLPTDKLRNIVNFLQSFDDGDKK